MQLSASVRAYFDAERDPGGAVPIAAFGRDAIVRDEGTQVGHDDRQGLVAKCPFAGPKAVLAYLSRYSHRVAISNRRLIAADGTHDQKSVGIGRVSSGRAPSEFIGAIISEVPRFAQISFAMPRVPLQRTGQNK
jgi:hypothetical protein